MRWSPPSTGDTLSHYETLGVEPTATADEIRTAYRFATRRSHPDLGGDAEKMAAINRAYEVLSDPARRAAYDATGDGDEDISIAREAREVMVNILQGELEGYGDMIAKARAKAADGRRSAEMAAASLAGRIAKLQARRWRVKRDGEGENLVHALIDRQISGMDAERLRAEKAMKVLDVVAELLQPYSCEAEQPIQVNSIGTNGTGTTTWFTLR